MANEREKNLAEHKRDTRAEAGFGLVMLLIVSVGLGAL